MCLDFVETGQLDNERHEDFVVGCPMFELGIVSSCL